VKILTLSVCKRAIKRGNLVVIGAEFPNNPGKLFSSFEKLKEYVKVNAFHGECYIAAKK
jgi:hypothetical protein